MKTVVFLSKELFTPEQLELIGPADFYGENFESEEDVIEKSRGAEAILAAKSRSGDLRKKFFDSLPDLKFVSIYATGYDWIDLGAANEHGVTVSSCPGFSTPAVSDWTISMIQELCEPKGKTLGVIGLGRIGRATAEKAKAIGMKVVAWDQKEKTDFQVPLEELLKQSDVVSIHLSLGEGTEGFLSKEKIALMKPEAFLVNSAREGLMDINAVKTALESGKLAGAAVDLDIHSTTEYPNAITTPHTAWRSDESQKLGKEMFVGNLVAWRSGKPQHVL